MAKFYFLETETTLGKYGNKEFNFMVTKVT